MNANETTKATQKETDVSNDTSVNNEDMLTFSANDTLALSAEKIIDDSLERAKAKATRLDNTLVYLINTKHEFPVFVEIIRMRLGFFAYRIHADGKAKSWRYAIKRGDFFKPCDKHGAWLHNNRHNEQQPDVTSIVNKMSKDTTRYTDSQKSHNAHTADFLARIGIFARAIMHDDADYVEVENQATIDF
jgi:hypothetical protein